MLDTLIFAVEDGSHSAPEVMDRARSKELRELGLDVNRRVGSVKAISFSDDSIQDLYQRIGTDKKDNSIDVTVEEKPLEAEIDSNSTATQTTGFSDSRPETAMARQPEAPKQPPANRMALNSRGHRREHRRGRG